MKLLRSVLHMAWMLITVIPWGLALVLLSLRVLRRRVLLLLLLLLLLPLTPPLPLAFMPIVLVRVVLLSLFCC